jgi:glucose/arabinose dehydrogenase
MRRIVGHAAIVLLTTGVVALAILSACNSGSPVSPGGVQIERVFPDLSFQKMTNLIQPDGPSDLIFVTEQRGIVHVFSASDPQQADMFLDIRDRVNREGNEEGLLGLAFDPDYQETGYFYVYYSADNPRRSVLSRFTLDQEDADVADPDSEVTIMEIDQPYSNHNGGQLAFGLDGYLYVGLGDGGSAGDPEGNGQNLGTLLGSILRIDVSELSDPGDYEPGQRYGQSACETRGVFPLIQRPDCYGLAMSGKARGRK